MATVYLPNIIYYNHSYMATVYLPACEEMKRSDRTLVSTTIPILKQDVEGAQANGGMPPEPEGKEIQNHAEVDLNDCA